MWYSRDMGPRLVPIAAVALSMLLPVHAGAQVRRAPQPDPDMAELAAYRLTTGTLQKVTVAMQAFSRALESDAKYKAIGAAQQELDALQQKASSTAADERRMQALEQQLEQMSREMDAGDAQNLAEMERKIAAMPHMSEALATAGLSAREYALFTLSMMQSGFAAGLKKTGQLRQLPPGVSMENVQFVIDHEREIAALSAQMQGK